MLKRILRVDDEVVCAARVSASVPKTIGLKALADDGPSAAAVSDLRMPGMDGIELLTRVGRTSPEYV